MRCVHLLSHVRYLATVLLLLILIPGGGAWAEDVPPDWLIPPVSVERGMLLPTYTGCGGVSGVPASNEAYEQKVVERVNTVRAENGLPPLKRFLSLDDAARYHATDLAQDDYFDHDSYDRSGGDLVQACGWSARIQSYYPNWQSLAENIAAGYTTPESVMNGWMNSEGHRNNILSTSNWEIGVGYYQGGSWWHYWVQDFGRRSGVYPLVINQEATETDSRDVSLYIYGDDWQEMRLHNDSDSWTAWQPFQATLNWTLNGVAGERTVWVEMRDGSQTAASSDTIYLTGVPALGNLPNILQFTYSIPDERLLSTAHHVSPSNVGNDDPLTWTVATEGAWFTAAPTGGTTPTSFWITPTIFSTGTVVTYTGVVTVTVVNPDGVEGSPHRIDLVLRTVDTPLNYVYFPLILRDYTYTPPPPSPRYPDDPHYGSQWALEKVSAPEAWGLSTGQDILIAVVDTGADLEHPDLAGKVRTDIDYDFVNDDAVAADDHGHGTHVSGIAAAATDNGLGVSGVGWEANILPLKVLDENGDGWVADIVAAIRHAADNGADVINMSLGPLETAPCPAYLQEAVDYAYARGVLLVAAGGNSGTQADIFPANCGHVLGVAATTSSDERASYSSYGSHVSVAAPGSSIYSTGWTGDGGTDCTSGYCHKSGTSMATPHVAGLAALLYSRYPTYTPDQVASAILDNADDLGTPDWDMYTGCGRISAHQSLLQGAHDSSPVCLDGMGPWAVGAEDAQVTATFAPGEVIVALRPAVSGQAVEQLWRQVGATAVEQVTSGLWRVRVKPSREAEVLALLQADPVVALADFNYLVTAAP
ncbi:MAG: S8 family serine peptidase [Chloroflexota bacterium]|nr:S8 family serine peptidase [Chloroflexota bacterium]